MVFLRLLRSFDTILYQGVQFWSTITGTNKKLGNFIRKAYQSNIKIIVLVQVCKYSLKNQKRAEAIGLGLVKGRVYRFPHVDNVHQYRVAESNSGEYFLFTLIIAHLQNILII